MKATESRETPVKRSPRADACGAALAAGVVGIALCALQMEPGDGVLRVTAVVRLALVLTASSLVALWFIARPPASQAVYALAAALAAIAMALAFGVGRSSTVALTPFQAVGPFTAAAGVSQVVALVVAAILAFRPQGDEGKPGAGAG